MGNPLYNEFKDNNATPQYRLEVRAGLRGWLGGWPERGCLRGQRRAQRGRCLRGQRHAKKGAAARRPPAARASRWPALCPAQILKRLPHLKKLDGIPVDVDERESAAKA